MFNAPKKPISAIALALVAALLASACSGFVYKQDIQQGNVLDKDDVAELETGMSKRQVEVLLGTPSIKSPFHAGRWDYMNSYAKRGGEPRKRVLTLLFENEQLAAIEGDYLDEENVASEALDELQEAEDAPIQNLETIRENEPPTGPDTGPDTGPGGN